MKFKVWDSKIKRFLADEWPFFISQKGELYFCKDYVFKKADPWFISVLSTGKTDKNGVELFGGDDIEEGRIFYSDDYLGFFVDTGATEFEDGIKPLYDIVLPEKIGNKFENPGLLSEDAQLLQDKEKP